MPTDPTAAPVALEPCPHCGHAAMWVNGVERGYAIVCGGKPKCRASVGMYGGGLFASQIEAVEAWNRRPVAAQEARCANLNDMLEGSRTAHRNDNVALIKAEAAIEEARVILAAWDINSLPNDMPLKEVAEARVSDLQKYMNQADALAARLADAERERDNQYDENVNRIATEGAAILRAEAAEAREAALREALTDLTKECEEYARINHLHNDDGSPATTGAMKHARAALSKTGEPT